MLYRSLNRSSQQLFLAVFGGSAPAYAAGFRALAETIFVFNHGWHEIEVNSDRPYAGGARLCRADEPFVCVCPYQGRWFKTP
jgi:hypothetical protein